MTQDRRSGLEGWTVGDRFWTPMNGTATVHKLRPRKKGAPEALVSYAWLPDVRQWIVLRDVEPMRPDEPDRPSEGLQQAEVGQQVWHSKFGEGIVRHLYEGERAGKGAVIEFGPPFGEREIALGGGYLRAEKPPAFAVTFTECDAGWIRLRLTAMLIKVRVDLSHVYDPFPDLIAWLEAMAIGVQRCGFVVNEEGCFTTFDAERRPRYDGRNRVDELRFRVTQTTDLPSADTPRLDVRIERRQLVRTFYEALRRFAASDGYVPDEWQPYALADRAPEVLGYTVPELVERSIHLSERELDVALWPLQPLWSLIDEGDLMTADEIQRATGKAWDGEGSRPALYGWCDGWDRITDAGLRRQRLYEVLNRKELGYEGTPLRELRSELVERWLADEGRRSG